MISSSLKKNDKEKNGKEKKYTDKELKHSKSMTVMKKCTIYRKIERDNFRMYYKDMFLSSSVQKQIIH